MVQRKNNDIFIDMRHTIPYNIYSMADANKNKKRWYIKELRQYIQFDRETKKEIAYKITVCILIGIVVFGIGIYLIWY